MEENKKYEDAIKELEMIVNRLEKGELPLEESLGLFKKGVELTQYCNKKLDETEKKITLLLENENGEVVEQPFDMEDR